jgi:hypothetical protein
VDAQLNGPLGVIATVRTQLQQPFDLCQAAPKERGMTSFKPLDPGSWPTTGVDLQTRRVRVLQGLAALGRTAEQRQFRSRCQAFMGIAEPLADGYVHAWYQHVIALHTTPGWAERWDALYRRGDPRALDSGTSMLVQAGDDTDDGRDFDEVEWFLERD